MEQRDDLMDGYIWKCQECVLCITFATSIVICKIDGAIYFYYLFLTGTLNTNRLQIWHSIYKGPLSFIEHLMKHNL